MPRRPAPALARPAVAASLLLLALAVPVGAAPAGEESPAARLDREWPSASDDARRALLDAVVAAPSSEAFAAVRRTAEVAAGMAVEAGFLRRRLAEESGGPDAVQGARKPGTPDAGLGDVEARETRALDTLAAAGGTVLRALPDADFEKAVRETVSRTSAKGVAEPFPPWAGEAIGRSAQPRSLPLLLAVAADRLAAYRKSLAARAGPARKLDEVNAKIADALERYLKAEQAKGDFSAKVPAGLLGTLPQQKKRLEAQVLEHQVAMDAAETERGAARAAVARLLASLAGGEAVAALEHLERAALADADPDVRAFGLGALGLAAGERALAHLTKAAADADARIAAVAVETLGRRREDAALAALAQALRDDRWRVRASAAAALARSGRAAAVPPLLDALGRAQGRDLDDLRDALRRLTGRELAAAEGPWRDWWEREGATFRGPADPAGPAPAVAGGAAPAAADAGGEAAAGVSFYGIETHSTRVLFVLDFSGSMNFAGSERDGRRKKVDVLRDELKKTVASLPDGAVFNLVGFANDVKVWRADPAVRSAKTAAAALEWVAKKDVLGATNIYDALETAFRLMGVGTAKDRSVEPVYDTVFFMTDGKPTSGKVTSPDRILAEVRRWNAARRVRIHVVGMGGHEKANPAGGDPEDDVDPAFLRRLAEDNGGQCVLR